MANIGDLTAYVNADTTGLERGMQRGAKSLKSMDTGMQRTMRVARRLTGVLGALGLGMGLGAAVRQVADFQVAMNGLAATSNATGEQMKALEEQARSLGATSKFSAQQAAEGQRFLAMAGFEVNEVLGATPGILQLATAAQLDLGTAADIASNVLGGMRLEVSELNRVNDVLAATASRSNTTIQQLGQALSFAAPFAAGAGISIEEAAAAIGNMSDAGIQASRAGTGLVGVIRQLSNVTGPGEEVLEKYSLSLADVDIEARGLGPVLETLRSKNMSASDSIKLFGSEAGAAAQVLVSDFSGGIQGATGEAARMASEFEKGLTPAFLSLKSAISESVLQMGGSGLGGALEGLIRTSTGVISAWNGMSDTWAEANNVGNTAKTVVEGLAAAIAALAAAAGARAVQAIGSLIAAKAGLTAASITLTGALTALRTVAATLFGPVGLLVGGATLVYQFREQLGLVPKTAKSASERIDDLSDSLDTNSRSALENAKSILAAEQQLNSFRAATLAMSVAQQQQKVFDEQEQWDAVGGQAAFGMGAQSESQKRLSDLRNQLADAQGGTTSASEALREIDKLMDGLGKAGEGLNDTYDKLVPTNEQAGKLGDKIKPVNEALGGATTAVDTFTGAALGAARRMSGLSPSQESRVAAYDGKEVSRHDRSLEGAIARLRKDRAEANMGFVGGDGSGPMSALESYDAISAKYSAFGSSSGQSASQAMQTTDQRSGKNLGTLKLASEKGGSIDVQANSDRLTSWLADTLSGTAASA